VIAVNARGPQGGCCQVPRAGVEVDAMVPDMRQYDIDQTYDLIGSHGCLHLVECPQWRALIDAFKVHAAPGGFGLFEEDDLKAKRAT